MQIRIDAQLSIAVDLLTSFKQFTSLYISKETLKIHHHSKSCACKSSTIEFHCCLQLHFATENALPLEMQIASFLLCQAPSTLAENAPSILISWECQPTLLHWNIHSRNMQASSRHATIRCQLWTYIKSWKCHYPIISFLLAQNLNTYTCRFSIYISLSEVFRKEEAIHWLLKYVVISTIIYEKKRCTDIMNSITRIALKSNMKWKTPLWTWKENKKVHFQSANSLTNLHWDHEHHQRLKFNSTAKIPFIFTLR